MSWNCIDEVSFSVSSGSLKDPYLSEVIEDDSEELGKFMILLNVSFLLGDIVNVDVFSSWALSYFDISKIVYIFSSDTFIWFITMNTCKYFSFL